jgi:hypothetical protein
LILGKETLKLKEGNTMPEKNKGNTNRGQDDEVNRQNSGDVTDREQTVRDEQDGSFRQQNRNQDPKDPENTGSGEEVTEEDEEELDDLEEEEEDEEEEVEREEDTVLSGERKNKEMKESYEDFSESDRE